MFVIMQSMFQIRYFFGRIRPTKGSVHVRSFKKKGKMEVKISDFDETWYNRCPIWEYEIPQV